MPLKVVVLLPARNVPFPLRERLPVMAYAELGVKTPVITTSLKDFDPTPVIVVVSGKTIVAWETKVPVTERFPNKVASAPCVARNVPDPETVNVFRIVIGIAEVTVDPESILIEKKKVEAEVPVKAVESPVNTMVPTLKSMDPLLMKLPSMIRFAVLFGGLPSGAVAMKVPEFVTVEPARVANIPSIVSSPATNKSIADVPSSTMVSVRPALITRPPPSFTIT